MASLRFALLSSVSIAVLVAKVGCSAAETSPESFGGAGGTGGSGGAGAAGSGGTGGFAGYAAGGGVGGSSGTGGTGGSAGLDGGSGGSSGSPAVCVAMPACDAPLPNVGSKRPWKHTSSVFVASGFANHRGRDLLLMPQSDQWIIGKFAYGIFDDDLKDEEVDIWLNRECGSSWEKLATVLTTEENAHPSVEGVTDSGGRVYFQIPADKKLGIGRHRLRLVVGGDLTGADVYIEVLPSGVPFFVADVDGTLTSEETEEYGALLTSSVSDARPDAATALGQLVSKGYRPFYITARPEFLVGRTREFLKVHGFPLGLVHTTTALGATGSAAVGFKKAELDEAIGRGALMAWGFGNTQSDADAYFLSGIQPNEQRVFIQFTDAAHGGRRIEAYTELLGELAQLPGLCP